MTILTINPGVQSDARSLNDSSLKVVDQSEALIRHERGPLAAPPKRASLQPMLMPLP